MSSGLSGGSSAPRRVRGRNCLAQQKCDIWKHSPYGCDGGVIAFERETGPRSLRRVREGSWLFAGWLRTRPLWEQRSVGSRVDELNVGVGIPVAVAEVQARSGEEDKSTDEARSSIAEHGDVSSANDQRQTAALIHRASAMWHIYRGGRGQRREALWAWAGALA
jgi:hypothetical protein